MSRRDSRASLNVRQSDALAEFENFKKKFLLANKHITKLNSTLSVRIEELQAEISTLYVENLRLRASEIALATQLKKEQEKSRKILADAEAATSNLSKHLCFLRQSLNVTSPGVSSLTLEPKPPPKTRHSMSDPYSSPQMPRLSRAPKIPGIYEDDEVASSPGADEDDVVHVSSSARRKAKERRLSPRLPLPPPRIGSPSPLPTLPASLHVSLVVERESGTKRKPSRRQSGFLPIGMDVVGTLMGSERSEGLMPPRAASPALGSPERRNAGLAEDDEERQIEEWISAGIGATDELDSTTRERKERKEKRSKQMERDVAREDADLGALRVKERKRRRQEEGSELKDVTNSPRSRTILPPLDTHTSDRDRQRTPETDAPTSAATSVTTSRTFLSTPATTPITTPQVSELPTPRTSSPVPLGATSASESEAPPGGRERRTRKSVNYAEPKLNTKMRKPDPVPPAPMTTTAPKKRFSSSMNVLNEDVDGRTSLDGPSRRPVSPLQPPAPRPSTATTTSSSSSTSGGVPVRRKKSRPFVPIDDDDESDGTQADAEYGNGIASGWINTDGRRRSGQGGSTARGSSSLRRVLETDDARRHSLAV